MTHDEIKLEAAMAWARGTQTWAQYDILQLNCNLYGVGAYSSSLLANEVDRLRAELAKARDKSATALLDINEAFVEGFHSGQAMWPCDKSFVIEAELIAYKSKLFKARKEAKK